MLPVQEFPISILYAFLVLLQVQTILTLTITTRAPHCFCWRIIFFTMNGVEVQGNTMPYVCLEVHLPAYSAAQGTNNLFILPPRHWQIIRVPTAQRLLSGMRPVAEVIRWLHLNQLLLHLLLRRIYILLTTMFVMQNFPLANCNGWHWCFHTTFLCWYWCWWVWSGKHCRVNVYMVGISRQ